MALGAATFSDAGGAASSIFSGITSDLSAQVTATGDIAEAQSYDLAAQLAGENEQLTKTQTAVKEQQTAREVYQTIGSQTAGVAAGGFAESGSALDLLRNSAGQGALSQALVGEQGQMTENSYAEQQQSYQIMASALQNEASQESSLGGLSAIFGGATGALKGAAAIATLL